MAARAPTADPAPAEGTHAPEGAWPDAEVLHRGERRPVGGILGALVRALDRIAAPFWRNPFLFLVLVAATVWAGVWGFTSFYGSQYLRVPWYAWPFVPDSPLSTTLWLVAALALKAGLDRRRSAAGKAWAFFANWAAMMNIKVGLWTVFVLLFYYERFFGAGGTHAAFQWVLVFTHAGMVGLAILLMRKVQALPPAGYVWILVLGLLWDFMDYFFVPLFLKGTDIAIYPNGVPAEPEDMLRVVAAVTVALTLLATTAVTLVAWRRGPAPRGSERRD